jgi:hypothetical protein
VEYNNWLEYQWDTQFEFGLMMLDLERYTGADISKYIPFIESGLTFYNEHYQYQAKMRSRSVFDGDGHLILYPGTAVETYKMAYNATSTIAALKTILTRLLELPENYLSAERRLHWEEMLKRIPPIAFREKEGHKTISPAWTWARINNQEIPSIIPCISMGNVWNWKTRFGDCHQYLEIRNRPAHSEKPRQLAPGCHLLCTAGFDRRGCCNYHQKATGFGTPFSDLLGPGHDWVPDHNWGGSGMIGLQEMLMQTVDDKIFLFPAWPKEWDVSFKLHAPYNTTVEGVLKDGKLVNIIVTPESRKQNLEIMLK